MAQGLPARRRASRLRARPTVRRCTPVRRRRHPPPRADPPAQPAPRPLHHRGPEQERRSPPAAGDRRATRTNRHAARPTASTGPKTSLPAEFGRKSSGTPKPRQPNAVGWSPRSSTGCGRTRASSWPSSHESLSCGTSRPPTNSPNGEPAITRSIPGATGLEPATSGVTDRQEGAPSLIKPHELRMVEPNPGNAVLVHVALWGRAGCHVTAKPEASCC